MSATPDEVFQQLADMIVNWQTFLDQQREWMAGPDADNDTNETDQGKRALVDSTGNSVLVDTPAELERRITAVIAALDLTSSNATLEARVTTATDNVETLIADAQQALTDVDNALSTATSAQGTADDVLTQLAAIQSTLTALRDETVTAKNNALIYQQGALDSQLQAQTYRDEIKVQKFILVSNKAAVASTLPADCELVGLTVPGEAGFFVFDPADLSTEVAADVSQATYIAPDTDTTGASGAWTRI